MNIEKCDRLLENRDFSGAKRCLRHLLMKDNSNTEAMYLLSIAEAELGNADDALKFLSRVISIEPRHAEAHYTKAKLLISLNRHLDALPHHDQAVELLPLNPWAFINRGISRAALKNFKKAICDFDTAIHLDPMLSVAYGNKGNALLELEMVAESLQLLDEALKIDSFNVNALSGKSACLLKLGCPEDALNVANRSIELKPDHPEAWNNRGNALNSLGRYEMAFESYERCIKLKPNYAEAWSNHSVTLNYLKRHEEALASCNRSIELKPDYPEAWNNRSIVLSELKRHEEALASFERALELKPCGEFWLGSLIHEQLKICDWAGLEQRRKALEDRLLLGDRVSRPFFLLGLFDNPELLKRCAEVNSGQKLRLKTPLKVAVQIPKRGKIRVGYFSMDFREHPVSYLIVELLELHDRSNFEILGFSFGAQTEGQISKRVEKAFDKFLGVNNLGDFDIACLSRQQEIDIAIDLGGYTQNSRPQIFAERAAPIQINYLGYPGTLGAKHLDYLIADSTLIPQDARDGYTEKIIYLPNSYQVNDSKRAIPDRIFTRQEAGLPENEFVFCCFNNNWKILPEIFDCWAGILQSVNGSVLWLFEDNLIAAKNLRKEATHRNIDPERLVFATRMPHAQHLARYKLADLFLDTFPYNAHTTASDALWAGVPVLTLQGQSFAARVASSLLASIGISELITHSKQEYLSLAVELALNPDKLAEIRERLEKNRLTAPLFDTKLFAKHIESAYESVYERYHAGMTPDHIYVDR